MVGQTVSVSLSWNGAGESCERNAKEGFVSLQKKMGGMVNEGWRYMDEVECSVCSKGCEDCWKTVGIIYLGLTFVGRATFSRPGEMLLFRQATPQSLLVNVDDE